MHTGTQVQAVTWNQSFLIKMQYFLVTTLPLGVLGFAFAVTFFALGVALTPLGIGIPILYFALLGCKRLQELDAQALGRKETRKEEFGYLDEPQTPAEGKRGMKAVLLSLESYLPVAYWILKLPISLVQFVLAVAFPVAGFILLFAPLVYLAAAQWYGFNLFADDLVMDKLLPMASPQERSYVVAGVGLVWFLIGIYLVNRMFRASIWFANAWGK
ncbi:sensor domain-containing protein [Paenibacillus puerhi]|uniref:sensor domain-containing protein n=1 Tax=Paenibacillus puerhi TaxID=2692622 RepID=UPI0013570F4A|nr:sensor domain-containing protein [Paenibacillus puerhi]